MFIRDVNLVSPGLVDTLNSFTRSRWRFGAKSTRSDVRGFDDRRGRSDGWPCFLRQKSANELHTAPEPWFDGIYALGVPRKAGKASPPHLTPSHAFIQEDLSYWQLSLGKMLIFKIAKKLVVRQLRRRTDTDTDTDIDRVHVCLSAWNEFNVRCKRSY